MSPDVAVFLDLDNLSIGAKQANLTLDLELLLAEIERMTNGRIVLQRAYGDARQPTPLPKTLATLGFTFQTAVRLNNFSKNLADMQIVVDTMETLIDGHDYAIYVLISGDRDFTPLVQTLRKRGKRVIGIGVRHATSPSLVQTCDQFVYYEDILPTQTLTQEDINGLFHEAIDDLLAKEARVRASVVKQHLMFLSNGRFSQTPAGSGSFRQFLNNYSDQIAIEQQDTTIYVTRLHKGPTPKASTTGSALHKKYRTHLKKLRLRIVPPRERLTVIRDLIRLCQEQPDIQWRAITETLNDRYKETDLPISKNLINAVLLVARRAQVLQTTRNRSFATSPVTLNLNTNQPILETVLRCDGVYLQEIINLEEPFQLHEAALALYDSEKYIPHLNRVMEKLSL